MSLYRKASRGLLVLAILPPLVVLFRVEPKMMNWGLRTWGVFTASAVPGLVGWIVLRWMADVVELLRES